MCLPLGDVLVVTRHEMQQKDMHGTWEYVMVMVKWYWHSGFQVSVSVFGQTLDSGRMLSHSHTVLEAIYLKGSLCAPFAE